MGYGELPPRGSARRQN